MKCNVGFFSHLVNTYKSHFAVFWLFSHCQSHFELAVRQFHFLVVHCLRCQKSNNEIPYGRRINQNTHIDHPNEITEMNDSVQLGQVGVSH